MRAFLVRRRPEQRIQLRETVDSLLSIQETTASSLENFSRAFLVLAQPSATQADREGAVQLAAHAAAQAELLRSNVVKWRTTLPEGALVGKVRVRAPGGSR